MINFESLASDGAFHSIRNPRQNRPKSCTKSCHRAIIFYQRQYKSLFYQYVSTVIAIQSKFELTIRIIYNLPFRSDREVQKSVQCRNDASHWLITSPRKYNSQSNGSTHESAGLLLSPCAFVQAHQNLYIAVHMIWDSKCKPPVSRLAMRTFPRCYRVFMHVWAPCILGAILRDWKLDRRMNYGFRKCRGYVEMRCLGV